MPGKIDVRADLALAAFHATGSTREGEELFSHLTPEEAASAEGVFERANWADSLGDIKEVIRPQRLQPTASKAALDDWEQDVLAADNLFIDGTSRGRSRGWEYSAEMRRAPGTRAQEPAHARIPGDRRAGPWKPVRGRPGQ